MIKLADIPVWFLVALNVAAAGGLWWLFSRVTHSTRARLGMVVVLGISYAGILLRLAADHGSPRAACLIVGETYLAVLLSLLPFLGFFRTELMPAAREGRAPDKAKANAVGRRMTLVILGLMVVFVLLDALLIRGFAGTHA